MAQPVTLKIKEVQALAQHPIFYLNKGMAFATIYKFASLAKQINEALAVFEKHRIALIESVGGELVEATPETPAHYEFGDKKATFDEAYAASLEETVELTWAPMPISMLEHVVIPDNFPPYQFMTLLEPFLIAEK